MTEDEKKVYAIYESYKAAGGTLSYEDWLASIKGEKGDTGATGPKGDKGDPGADGTNGTNGTDGKDGTNGTNGVDGTAMLTGSGAPTDTLGKDGDSYVDIATWDYYVKASGAWTLKGNIKGANGVDGTNGTNGTDGLTPYIGTNGNWWIGTVDTGVYAGVQAGSKEHPIEIANVNQFRGIHHYIDEMKDGKPYFFKLTGDIDLRTNNSFQTFSYFYGGIDGNGYTITLPQDTAKIKYDSDIYDKTMQWGVFSQYNGSLENVTLKSDREESFIAMLGVQNAGEFAGTSVADDNKTLLKDITVKTITPGKHIAAANNDNILVNWVFNTDATIDHIVNNVDYDTSTWNGAIVGGYAMYSSITFKNCINYGNITSQKYAGFLMGNSSNFATNNGNFDIRGGNANYGHITAGTNWGLFAPTIQTDAETIAGIKDLNDYCDTAVAKATEVSNYDELAAAVAASTTKETTISLLADITSTAVITLPDTAYPVTILGHGHTINSSANYGIEIAGGTAMTPRNVAFTELNLNVTNATEAVRGISVDPDAAVNMYVWDTTIVNNDTHDNYGINLGLASTGSVTIEDSNITAYVDVNVHSKDLALTILNSTLTSRNNHNASYTGSCVHLGDDTSTVALKMGGVKMVTTNTDPGVANNVICLY
jgi:hypothetical protein